MSLLRRRMMMRQAGLAPAHPEIEHYNANDLLLTIRYNWTRRYIKYLDGFCISGSYKINSTWTPTNIVVVGLSDDAVLFGYTDSSSPPHDDVSSSIKTINYNGVDYKVVLGVFAMPGVPEPTYFNGKTYTAEEVNSLLPAIDLLNYYYYGEA